jgi:protein-S-isoprenylcysteine O-methyltransferase Ste14
VTNGGKEFLSAPISRRWDLLAAAPLILLSLVGIAGFGIQIYRELPLAGFDAWLQAAIHFAGALYLSQKVYLLSVRRLPLLRLADNRVRAFCLLAANFELSILLLPKLRPPPGEAMLSAILLLAGTAGSILVLHALGKSFAVFPQARILVTRGPYRFVRHPLYMMEEISTLGLSLQVVQPWGLLIAVISFLLQFPRMRFEEAVLVRAFPDYTAYARRTPRFLPFWRFGPNR